MITNISAVNKDGIRMTIGEYDMTRKVLKVSYSKSRLDMEMKAAQIRDNQVTQSDTFILRVEEHKPLGQILTVKYFEIPAEAETVLFCDREFDNRYETKPQVLKDSYDKETNTYKVDLAKLKRTR